MRDVLCTQSWCLFCPCHKAYSSFSIRFVTCESPLKLFRSQRGSRISIVTTTDISSFDPALHAYQESDARTVLDLVLHQQIGTFSALKIVQVAELLPSWISRNIIAITNGRADDTRDWYFPVFTRTAIPTQTRTSNSSSWSGIHHLVENEASATVHPLPALPAVPPPWRISTIVASKGGLLLLMPPTYPVPSLENGDVVHRPCRVCGSAGRRHVGECSMNSNSWGRTKSWLKYAESRVSQDWKPLLVCNPLTKSWRELPPVENGEPSLKWRYDEVLIDMIVDERSNSYTIVMTFRNSFSMCIYTSTSNTWAHHRYMPFFLASRETWKSYNCANAVVRGRLYYAFLEYRLDTPTLATLLVFEIKLETGERKPWKEYALRVHVWDILVARYIQRILGWIGRKASEVLHYLALVECMGEMYAVIPTRRDEIIFLNNTVAPERAFVNSYHSRDQRYEAMPVQFHILRLNCENAHDVHCGVLWIQVPRGLSDIPLRRMSLLEKTSIGYFPYWNWFSCSAKGSVIWVAFEDYLLRYDVLSGESKTHIIRKPRLVNAGVSYRPSFHMNP